MRIIVAHRYEALDGLRGVAALCVMACHFGQMLDVYWPANMFLAVDIFFMMSGFVIMYSYGERLRNGMPAWSYLGRRLVRLYPMFIVGLLIGAGALYFGAQKDVIAYRTEDILRSLLFNSVYLPFPNAAHLSPCPARVRGQGSRRTRRRGAMVRPPESGASRTARGCEGMDQGPGRATPPDRLAGQARAKAAARGFPG